MFGYPEYCESSGKVVRSADGAREQSLSRRSLLGAGAILGLAAMTAPIDRAFAWSSWTNATSSILKKTGMGDCVHEDLVQIAYARLLRNHAGDDNKPNSLLNPWAGKVRKDRRYAEIAGDVVDAGKGKTFANADALAACLFRENLAYLRIGSFWNDAAADTLADFALSCYYANSVAKFSGSNYYRGAWDVGQHIWETNEQNKKRTIKGRDALVQFTLNDRNGFIHGMLTSTANHSGFLKQSDVKRYVLQWLGVAYEYARTGKVTATGDVTKEQADKIFKGFIDTYGQLSENAHDMRVSLKASWSEASSKLPHRRLRLRALGMVCHTLEDLWCPAHTCRTYHAGGSIPQNTILAFSNYKLQNGNKMPLFGYHLPFDRYAVSDSKNSTNWREALTRGKGAYKGTETLANVLDAKMSCLDNAHTYFNTLGMNETIACITQLFEYLYQGTAWDDGVRNWVDAKVMPTYFDGTGQSFVCDAGRRSLHTPTYIIAPITSMKRAYRKAGLQKQYNAVLAAAKSYDAWQRGAHNFYSGKYNTGKSKYIKPGNEGASIWADNVGESRLIDLVNKLYESYSGLSSKKKSSLLSTIGPNGCHDMASALNMVGGMLQEFSIDLTGDLRPNSDATLKKLKKARSFFQSGLKGGGSKAKTQSLSAQGLMAAGVAFADEGDDGDEGFMTSNMALEAFASLNDGSYLTAVRDMDSLETSIMSVPANTPGKDKLEEGLANLTITYTLQTEFEDDLDYRYIVSEIDYSDQEENTYLITGTVKSVSADKKGLVLDLNGISDLALAIGSAVPDIPQVGDYICARYSGSSSLELVGYDELDAPEELIKVTYPVALVAGSSVWLLTNGGESDAEDGYRDYLQIDYGSADVYSVPQEGYYATVYYHDEAYGDTTDVDENALATAAVAADFTNLPTQVDEDELEDSATTPGYLELGDDYGNLNYGNEVFHVANVIVGLNEMFDDSLPDTDNELPVPTGDDDSSSGSEAGSAASKSSSTRSSTSKSSSTTSSTVPKTDDPLAGFNGLLSAVAVAGTALAAYSARRTANERGSSEED